MLDSPEWQRANLDSDLLVPVLWVGCLMFLGWSLGACVLAWFAWRRHNWARWLLAASAVATVVAAIFAFPVGVLHQPAAAGGSRGAVARRRSCLVRAGAVGSAGSASWWSAERPGLAASRRPSRRPRPTSTRTPCRRPAPDHKQDRTRTGTAAAAEWQAPVW